MQSKNNIDELLADSFMEIAQKVPIEKITIKEITDRAGVIRPTFYNHFQDKYEVIEWILRYRVFASVEVLLQNGMIKEATILIFKNMQNNKGFYIRAAKLEGQNSFGSIVEKCVKEAFQELFMEEVVNSTALQKHPWMSKDMVSGYYANGITFILMQWIQNGMNVPAEEMAVLCDYIENKSLRDIIEELKN